MSSGDRSAQAALLLQLMDEDVVKILKKRLSAAQRADLIEEILNPYKELTTQQKAELGGVSPRTIQRHGK